MLSGAYYCTCDCLHAAPCSSKWVALFIFIFDIFTFQLDVNADGDLGFVDFFGSPQQQGDTRQLHPLPGKANEAPLKGQSKQPVLASKQLSLVTEANFPLLELIRSSSESKVSPFSRVPYEDLSKALIVYNNGPNNIIEEVASKQLIKQRILEMRKKIEARNNTADKDKTNVPGLDPAASVPTTYPTPIDIDCDTHTIPPDTHNPPSPGGVQLYGLPPHYNAELPATHITSIPPLVPTINTTLRAWAYDEEPTTADIPVD
ncbi:hypothetical protein Pelo_9748 [Pelomyxa schiedti]|nr:hypothetical protein Pelo_9748 [Pelomyxa schiedti]